MEVIGTMGEWTLWSTCTFEACGTDFDPNKQLRKRTCVPQSLGNLGSVNIICNDTDIEISKRTVQPPFKFIKSPWAEIDGNWSEWSAWNTSNPTNVTRERLCNNPKPSENGNKCNGSSTQVLGSMTDWTEWSDCQETTCGLGFNNQTKSRTRNCSAEQYGSGIEVVCNSSTLETSLVTFLFHDFITVPFSDFTRNWWRMVWMVRMGSFKNYRRNAKGQILQQSKANRKWHWL